MQDPNTNTGTAPSPRRLAVLISGEGTNLQALIDAQNTPSLPNTQIVLVLSNRKNARGLIRASTSHPHPIPTAYIGLQPFLRSNPGKTREDYDVEVARIVLRAKPDAVVCAGWMHIVSEGFLDVLKGTRVLDGEEVLEREVPVINIHPALFGQFDGTHAVERGFEAFQKGEVDELGVMVHRVVKEVDRGEPLIQRRVEVVKGEAIEAYEERLHKVEWEIIVEATRMVLDELQLPL
ncbi:phosphoribosylglycinamide formyltransferase [Suillus clintonianus]|uniref:phosphoribosylglycinamide formyltransferase n=1 Tax=Suillus clintonianus TaxID=1904413 RepID=UPI001B8766F8|nr:phosphoribosylglycinamide formyltransferase [Suillus clintonianus]KAG2121927.1 phosphoribosylglycinamide formyltransferase [Suillus clintonianus]